MDPLPTSFASTRVGVHTSRRARTVRGPLRHRRAHRPHPGWRRHRHTGVRRPGGRSARPRAHRRPRRRRATTPGHDAALGRSVLRRRPRCPTTVDADHERRPRRGVGHRCQTRSPRWPHRFALVSTALATVHPAASPTLWPEHFDLAVTVAGATYGGSPGDATHSEPYLYVTPPGGPVPDGDRQFWNEPFGASLTYDRITGAAGAVGFFTEAMARVAASSTEVGS